MHDLFDDLKLDILFKFVFGSDSPDSLYLLRILAEGTIGRTVGTIFHKNVESIRCSPNDKGIRYDVYFGDEHLNSFDVEMQNSPLTLTQVKRFGFYGNKLVNSNIIAGDDYELLKRNVQIVFINQPSDCLIGAYLFRDDLNRIEGHHIPMVKDESLLIRYYVFIPYIDELEKTKALEDFSDFELIVYTMNNGMNEKMKKLKRKVVKMMDKRISEFNADDLLASQAFDRKVYLATEKAEHNEYREMGRKEGKSQRELEITLEMTAEAYPEYDCSWIMQLDESQLKYARHLLMKQFTYEEFYASIQDFVH